MIFDLGGVVLPSPFEAFRADERAQVVAGGATGARSRSRRPITALGSLALVVALTVGAAACGGGDTQGRQEPELSEVEAQVAQLRLEVQSLRRELAELQATTTTTLASATSTTTR